MLFAVAIPWIFSLTIGVIVGWFIRHKSIYIRLLCAGLNAIVLGMFSVTFYAQLADIIFGCVAWGCIGVVPIIRQVTIVSMVLAALPVLIVRWVMRVLRNHP